MRKIILLLENGLLAQLYKTNLGVYLESQIEVCHTYREFTEHFKRIDEYLMVVSQFQMDGLEMHHELAALFKENQINIPVLIVGEQHQDESSFCFVKDYFNIQNILSTSARQLGITAQMMANYKVPEFYPVDIEFIHYLKLAPTSLYLELNDDFVMFAKKGAVIEDLIQDLKAEGVNRFYIKSLERLEVVAKITEILKEALMKSNNLNVGQKTEIIANGFDYFINNYVSPQASQAIVQMASDCSKMMADVVEESQDLQSLFFMFRNNRDNFLYIHTMLSVYVASHIIRNVPWGGGTQIEKLNFVFFFHDIYLAPIFVKYPHIHSEEALLNSHELTRQEKSTVMNHARYAAELVINLKKAPMGSDQLIRQHHGQSTGIGFVEEYKDDISPLAKVMMVAESFVEEFLKSKERNPDLQIEIIEIMHNLNEKFKKNSYKKIVETLLTLNI